MSEHTNSNAVLSLLNIPHFRGIWKRVLDGHYSFKTAMTDIIDNVILKANRIDVNVLFHQGKLFKINISDDYENGFENIKETGTANPMNWTHCRAGQTSDEETSEYGTGLKEASCFLAHILRIYTRAVKEEEVSYHEVEWKFDEMAGRETPEASFMVDISQVEQATYKEFHPFETGSTIELDGIRCEDAEFIDLQQCIDELKVIIADAYSDIIANRPGLAIHVNGMRILPEHDHFRAVLQHPTCRERLIQTTVAAKLEVINGVSKVVKTMAKVVIPGNDTIYYDFNEGKTASAKPTKESVSISEITTGVGKQMCECMIADENNRIVSIESSTTHGTNLEKTHIFKGAVRHKRKGRNYGDIQIVNLKGSVSNDGYLNHVYHELNWDSKELNPPLGICSNKQINSERKGMLRLSICKLLGKINNRLTSQKPKKPRKSSGDNDSDNASVSTTASSVSDITMNSATSSRRRTVIPSPIQRGSATTSIAAAEPTTTVQPDNATIVSADETANNAEPDATLQEQPLSGSNNIVAEEPPRQPNIQEMIYARLNETIAEVEHTLAEQLPAPPVTNTPEEVPEVNPQTATVPIQPLRQTNPVYTRITNQDRTYLSKRDAEIQLENLSTFAHQNPHIHIEDDMMELITEIARQSGGILFLIDTVKNMMTRGKPENAHVVGGSTLAKIHAKYISDDDIV